MFLKSSTKKDRVSGREYRYYKLCESYRIGEKTRHRTVCMLGKLEELSTNEERKILADRIEQLLFGAENVLLFNQPPHIEKLARHFYARLKRTKQIAIDVNEQSRHNATIAKDYQEIDVNSMTMEDARDIGGEWLCKQTLAELDVQGYLEQCGWSSFQVKSAMIHIISRAVYPASEHKTARWIWDNSAVAELFDLRPDIINRFQLYKASDMLYKEKDGIEEYLSKKTNELFDLNDKIILYDLTNTYFEGRKTHSKIAKFYKSKEKRSDAKLVALALVVNSEGFVKYSKILRGNIADCKTMATIVNELSKNTSTTGRKPTVVIDAGIATDDNLAMLKENHYTYVCVNRSRLKEYTSVGTEIIRLQDKRENPIEIRWVEKPECEDRFLYVRSEMKAVKEISMYEHFSERYEEELENLSQSIHKKGGTKKYEKVMERIGRIKERYSTANKHYLINVKEKEGIAIEITWSRKPLKTASNQGVYFIRTNLKLKEEETLWTIYNTIREIESTFRVLKTDLQFRPIFHKLDKRTIAHLNLAICAYMVVNTIRYRLKKHGIHHDWKNIVRIMNTQKAATITLDTKSAKRINVRICSIPSAEALEIYNAMGYKSMPFYRKKFVLPEK